MGNKTSNPLPTMGEDTDGTIFSAEQDLQNGVVSDKEFTFGETPLMDNLVHTYLSSLKNLQNALGTNTLTSLDDVKNSLKADMSGEIATNDNLTDSQKETLDFTLTNDENINRGLNYLMEEGLLIQTNDGYVIPTNIDVGNKSEYLNYIINEYTK